MGVILTTYKSWDDPPSTHRSYTTNWFPRFVMFILIGGHDPIWLIFFRWVESPTRYIIDPCPMKIRASSSTPPLETFFYQLSGAPWEAPMVSRGANRKTPGVVLVRKDGGVFFWREWWNSTRWVPTGYKWSYHSMNKWPYTKVTGILILLT